MMADPDQIVHLEEQIHILRRRQRVLETQRASYGPLTVPAHIALELEDTRADLLRAEAELRRERPHAPDSDNPYLGLLTFQPSDAASFFGRDALVAELVERVRQSPFLVVLGASGSGKSSVVRAGLIPQLQAGALASSQHWRTIILTPGVRPLDTLAAELAKLSGALELDMALRLSRSLAEDCRALPLACDLLLDRPHGQRLVLVIDQAEELWTQAPPEQREPFIAMLLHAICVPDAPCVIVLTMRADFLHRAIEHRALAEQIERHIILISPMQPQDLHDAIVRPAEIAGGTFEPGLVDELIKQVQGQPGALPLLEYTLLELWKRRAPDGLMSWAAYEELGRVEGALAARADQILHERYTAEQQDSLRQLLIRLVQPGEGTVDTRRRALLDDLIPAGESAEQFQRLIKPLADERLLTTGRDSVSGEETVEVSHEALIRDWPTLGRWINEARTDLRFQIQVEDAAREWEESERNAELLWSGLRLAQAESWCVRARPRLSARDQGFLAASRTAEQARHDAAEQARAERERLLEMQAATERRSAMRLRLLLGIGGVLLMLAMATLVYALQQNTLANASVTQAHAEVDAGEALLELNRLHIDRALLLAESSENQAPDKSDMVHRAMRDTIQQSTFNILLRGHTKALNAVAWNPNEEQVATVSDDGTAKIWDAATGQLITTYTGHVGKIHTVAWSPDGKQIVTAGEDQSAQVWDAATGKHVSRYMGHTSAVHAAAWSPDGKQIVTAGWDGTAQVWDAATGSGQAIFTSDIGSAINSLGWAPDGKRLVAASDNGTAHIWDLASKTDITLKHTNQPLNAVAWSHDGAKIATASFDTTAHLWDATTGKSIATLEGHTKMVLTIAWSPDSNQIVTASDDGTARVWDAEGRAIAVLKGHTGGIWTVAWSPDGTQIVTGSYDGTARIWDAATGSTCATLRGHTDMISAVAWNPNGKQIITASWDGTARIWDATCTAITGHTKPISSVQWSPDGTQILTASYDGTARIWDAATGKPRATLAGSRSGLWAAAWSPDGAHIVTASAQGAAQLWDATGKRAATLTSSLNGVEIVAWSPDGTQIATGNYDGAVQIWDATSQQTATLRASGPIIRALAWSPDSTHVVVASADGAAQVWDATTGSPGPSYKGHTAGIWALAWSPNGKQIVTASADHTAQVWDAATGDRITTYLGHSNAVYAVAWSPNGKTILTGSWDHTAQVWDAATGNTQATFAGHTDWVNAVAWNPDGKRIVTASADGTIQLWDLDTRESIDIFEGHTAGVTAVAWSPNGKQIVSASYDHTARVWVVDRPMLTAELTRRVCFLFENDEIRQKIKGWVKCTRK